MSRFYGKIQEYIYILYGTIPPLCLFNLFLIVVNSKIKLKLNLMFLKSYKLLNLSNISSYKFQLVVKVETQSSCQHCWQHWPADIMILAYANNIRIFCVPYAIESTNFHALSTHTHTNTHRYTCTRMQCPNQKFSNLLPHITNITNIITNIYIFCRFIYIYI